MPELNDQTKKVTKPAVIKKKKIKYPYLKDERLSDVIRLITLLAITEKYTFREIKGLETDLNGPPRSSPSWFDMAGEHPEFFRFTVNGEKLVLLLRFVSRTTVNKEETYPVLNIDQTQKLVDQAIELHDKQLLRYQRNNFKIPLWTSMIAAFVTLLTTAFNWFANIRLNQRFDKLTQKVDSIRLQVPPITTVVTDTAKVKQKPESIAPAKKGH